MFAEDKVEEYRNKIKQDMQEQEQKTTNTTTVKFLSMGRSPGEPL